MRKAINSKLYFLVTFSLIFSALVLWNKAQANESSTSELYAANKTGADFANYQEEGETESDTEEAVTEGEETEEPMPAPEETEEVSVEE